MKTVFCSKWTFACSPQKIVTNKTYIKVIFFAKIKNVLHCSRFGVNWDVCKWLVLYFCIYWIYTIIICLYLLCGFSFCLWSNITQKYSFPVKHSLSIWILKVFGRNQMYFCCTDTTPTTPLLSDNFTANVCFVFCRLLWYNKCKAGFLLDKKSL